MDSRSLSASVFSATTANVVNVSNLFRCPELQFVAPFEIRGTNVLTGRNGNSTDPSKDPNVHWDETIFNFSRHAYEDPTGISYTGMAYIDRPVKILATYNNTGDTPISPTYENAAMATWPLTRLVYFNNNKDPKKTYDPVLTELTKFVISQQGQQIVSDQGIFLPFRASQQSTSLKMLR